MVADKLLVLILFAPLMHHYFNNTSLEQLPIVAEEIIALLKNHKLWCFYGEMGAGKTTLIKAICNVLSIDDTVSSPTFSLVNEYTTNNGASVFHFDFYRINTLEEVFDIGYEEYFFSGNICLVEWPEKIDALLLTEKIAKISMVKLFGDCRDIRVLLQ